MAAPPSAPIEVAQVSTHMIPTWAFVLVFFILFVLIWLRISVIMRQRMLAGSKNAAQRSNVQRFINILRISLAVILGLAIFFTYTESFTALGVSAGVIGAVIGWALQKPIEGMAAFFLIVTRKPFRVGDRIDIEGMKGDVTDITMTHLYIEEVSGTTAGQDRSSRIIVIPTNILFDKRIINYTMNHEYMLDEVVTQVTYDSNIDKAMVLCQEAASKALAKFSVDGKTDPFCRMKFAPSGIDISTRYHTLARSPGVISSEITKEIYNRIRKTKDVRIAFPVTEVHLKKR